MEVNQGRKVMMKKGRIEKWTKEKIQGIKDELFEKNISLKLKH